MQLGHVHGQSHNWDLSSVNLMFGYNLRTDGLGMSQSAIWDLVS